MQIILLSGGSGKRLWPLSNEARSKQFLKLLKAPDGGFESMVQRVTRQIKESGLMCPVTVATSIFQKDAIENQLGESVAVVTEPCRRDTFPAICLATNYLHKVKGCRRDEVVVVMPSDPYTENGYFKTIGRMVEAVEKDQADLVLMGITPTYPSSKFGYVVPADKLPEGENYKVRRFTEKPSIEGAEALLKEGAFWNGGVFAFRLGYLLDISDRYVSAPSFEELRSRYEEFPKISFDYEVAEKASSVAVVPYSGQWKDLGTWNTLTDELSAQSIGNVIMDESSENTHVINELEVPIMCIGAKDLVVAASPDGILVSNKAQSEGIKHYADSLHRRPMYEERRWGVYKVVDYIDFDDGRKALTKQLIIRAGKHISYQLHEHRSEVWTIVSGEGQLVLDGIRTKVKAGDVIHVKRGQKHAIRGITDLYIIEVQTGDSLVEDDIQRFAYEWTA